MKKFYAFAAIILAAVAANAAPFQPLRMAPAAQATDSVAIDEPDWGEWISLGQATVTGLEAIENNLNYYRISESEPEYKFSDSTIVMQRTLASDSTVTQLKLCKFMGYDDVVLNVDPLTLLVSTSGNVDSSIPCPGYATEQLGATSLKLKINGSYSRARRIISISSLWTIFGDSGYGLQFENIEAILPDARPEVGIKGRSVIAGGTKSTDKSISIRIETEGVDHLRYVVHYNSTFSQDDLANVIAGNADYGTVTDRIDLDYVLGSGIYRILVVAFDANDSYMGMYSIFGYFSNLPTPGTWEDAGTAVWHHVGSTGYSYLDTSNGNENAEYVPYEYPQDQLSWNVKLEKLADPTREVYRVVNPYGSGCAMNPSFDFMLDKMYAQDMENRPPTYRTDDTFWFVVDVTDPSNVTYEAGRPTGHVYAYFMSTDFYYGELTMDGRKIMVSEKYVEPGSNRMLFELPEKDGIESVEAATDGAPAYFDLLGRRIDAPARGIFLQRTGNGVRKVRL